MRHKKANKRFGRNSSARKELINTLARNVVIYTKIKTTLVKAKEVSKLVDRLIQLGKKQTLHARRMIFAIIKDHKLVMRIEKDIAPLFKDRKGGYTRIMRLDNRKGDGAQMAILELVEQIEKKKASKKKKIKTSATAPADESQTSAGKKQKEQKEQEITQKRTEAEQKVKLKDDKKVSEPKQQEIKEKIKPLKKKEKIVKEKKKSEKQQTHPGWFNKVKGMFNKKQP